METAGEERIRAVNSLQELEEAALLLREAAESPNSESISVGFPARISGILNELTALSSREDGERLLAIGKSNNKFCTLRELMIGVKSFANRNTLK